MSHSPFERHVEAYDRWYDDHEGAYRAERTAIEHALPASFESSRALEVGVGTGRFAAPLEVSLGVDRARAPLECSHSRGVRPIRGVAESLPIAENTLEVALAVTVLAFVDPRRTLTELRRVLVDDGMLVVAVLDRASPPGKRYQEHADESPFYADATFLSADVTADALEEAGFRIDRRLQALFDHPAELAPDSIRTVDVRDGHGDGLFAVFRAVPEDG